MEASDSVQPEGQGAEGGGFVDQYLPQVPEDYREHVEPYLRDIESNANQRFQEHAQYKEQWEPYEELGLTDYEPESLAQLLQFAELMNDPEAVHEWWNRLGEENGYIRELIDDYGLEDEDEGEEGEEEQYDPQILMTAMQQMLDERLAPVLERNQEYEEQERVKEADSEIQQRVDAIQNEYDLSEDELQAVYKLSLAYIDTDGPDAITKGFADFQNLVGNVETNTVTKKAGGPSKPEGEGKPNTAAKAPTDWNEAKEMAKERFAQLQQG